MYTRSITHFSRTLTNKNVHIKNTWWLPNMSRIWMRWGNEIKGNEYKIRQERPCMHHWWKKAIHQGAWLTWSSVSMIFFFFFLPPKKEKKKQQIPEVSVTLKAQSTKWKGRKGVELCLKLKFQGPWYHWLFEHFKPPLQTSFLPLL